MIKFEILFPRKLPAIWYKRSEIPIKNILAVRNLVAKT